MGTGVFIKVTSEDDGLTYIVNSANIIKFRESKSGGTIIWVVGDFPINAKESPDVVYKLISEDLMRAF